MDSEKRYTVMELAELLGVPRTTINDWLSRYSMYAAPVMQGKRRVYSEATVSVLREIAALRNAGKAFHDIEQELAGKHPVSAVPELEKTVEEETPDLPLDSGEPTLAASQEGIGNNAAVESAKNNADEEYALIARRQSEEIGQMIGESFQSMAQRLEELENLTRSQRKNSMLWALIFILLICAIAAGGFLFRMQLQKADQENMRLHKINQDNGQMIHSLQAQTVTLIAGTKTFQANIARLEAELKEQQARFDKAVKESREAAEAAEKAGKAALKAEQEKLVNLHKVRESLIRAERDKALAELKLKETEIALAKEKFAAERLKLLKEKEEAETTAAAVRREAEKVKAEAISKEIKEANPAEKTVQNEKK